jgi:exonuclease V gamma subunit
MRDVEQALDPQDLRNQLTTVRERTSALRAQYRLNGRRPDDKYVREQILVPMTQVRVWLQEEIARQQNANSLVPLDRDPVPDNYSELVRKYYEKLGSAQ